jgi:hypothetical protein
MVQEAIELYCDGEDMELPKPSSLEQLTKNKEYNGGIWMMLDVNIDKLNLKPMKLDISLPAKLISHIDEYTTQHQMTRDSFLAMAAQEMLLANTTNNLEGIL